MTPRQMIEFGELYLDGGRVGDRQLIPREWVDKSDDGVGRSRWGSDREYGYGFWIREFAGHRSFYAWGYGGQFIFVIPGLDLVIVTTSRVGRQPGAARSPRVHLSGLAGLTLY